MRKDIHQLYIYHSIMMDLPLHLPSLGTDPKLDAFSHRDNARRTRTFAASSLERAKTIHGLHGQKWQRSLATRPKETGRGVCAISQDPRKDAAQSRFARWKQDRKKQSFGREGNVQWALRVQGTRAEWALFCARNSGRSGLLWQKSPRSCVGGGIGRTVI